MTKLPTLSGKEVATRLEKAGFVFVRQVGSHLILRRQEPTGLTVTVPDHKELKKGTLKNILRQAGITVEDLKKLK
ncbi:MAG: type II toxin-antitoxin system HicA family toxin [Dehalococcoidia bacterium]